MLCDASGDLYWIGALFAPISGFAAVRHSYELFPVLPEADPAQRPTDRDRKMLKRASVVSILIAVCCAALLLVALTPAREPMRFVSDMSITVGPTLLAFGVFGFVLPGVAKRMVRPGPLIHLLSKPRRLGPTIDQRRFMWVSSVLIMVLAVWLHLGLASVHLTFGEQGVHWRSLPWHDEQVQPWSELTDLRMVNSYENFIGRDVKKPHLVLTFKPPLKLFLGVWEDRLAGWTEAAEFASERSGVVLQTAKK